MRWWHGGGKHGATVATELPLLWDKPAEGAEKNKQQCDQKDPCRLARQVNEFWSYWLPRTAPIPYSPNVPT